MGFISLVPPICKHEVTKKLSLYYDEFKVTYKLCAYCNTLLDKQYYMKHGGKYVRCEDIK